MEAKKRKQQSAARQSSQYDKVFKENIEALISVSYIQLRVYKRQVKVLIFRQLLNTLGFCSRGFQAFWRPDIRAVSGGYLLKGNKYL